MRRRSVRRLPAGRIAAAGTRLSRSDRMRPGMDSGIRIRSDFISSLAGTGRIRTVATLARRLARHSRQATIRHPPAHCCPQQNTALGAIAFFARPPRPTLGSTSPGASTNEARRITGILESRS
ncbi:hypothetical protein BSLA_02r4730 [Burkholderia stabilis]|nr:hypothetical protein BSLA_02r4730 [Burkholderia stabilis]